MRCSIVAVLAVVLVAGVSLAADAQQPPRVGFLSANSAAAMSARAEAFRGGLREIGYVEGGNILTEYRYADGKIDRLPALAAELVHLKVNKERITLVIRRP